MLFAPSQLLLRLYGLLHCCLHCVWTSFASEFPVSCFVCACYFHLCSSVFFSVWCLHDRFCVGVWSCPHVTDPGFPCSGSFGYCCFWFHVVVLVMAKCWLGCLSLACLYLIQVLLFCYRFSCFYANFWLAPLLRCVTIGVLYFLCVVSPVRLD